MKKYLPLLCFILAAISLIFSCNSDGSGRNDDYNEWTPLTGIGPVVPAPRIQGVVVVESGLTGFYPGDNYQYLNNNVCRDTYAHPPANEWIIFKLPKAYNHLLFQWNNGHAYNYNVAESGAPGSYEIQVSDDGANWVSVVTVTGNNKAARSHEITRPNTGWIRFRATATPAGTSAVSYLIDEFDIHDLTLCDKGTAWDTWAFIGDSITSDSYWRENQNKKAFNELVHEGDPSRYPSMINMGIGSTNSTDLLNRLEQAMKDNPAIHFWAIGIGTNESDSAVLKSNLQKIVKMLTDDKRQPIIAHVPFRTDGNPWASAEMMKAHNVVIDEVSQEFQLPEGPDLYDYFEKNPTHLHDGIHPTHTIENAEGVKAINRLWSKVALSDKLNK